MYMGMIKGVSFVISKRSNPSLIYARRLLRIKPSQWQKERSRNDEKGKNRNDNVFVALTMV